MQIEINRELAAKVLEVVDAGLTSGKGVPQPGKMCVEAAVCYAMGLPHSDEPTCVAPSLRALKIRLNDSGWSSDLARAKGLRRLAVAQLGSAGALDEKEFVRRVVDYAIRVSTPKALRAAASVLKDEKHKAALCEAANRCEKEGTRQSAFDAKKAAYAAGAAYAAYAAYADVYAADAAAGAAYAAAADAADAAAYADVYAADAAAYAAAADAAADAAYAAYAAYADVYAAYAAAAAAAADAAKETRDTELSNYAEAVVQILVEMKAPGCQWLELTEAA